MQTVSTVSILESLLTLTLDNPEGEARLMLAKSLHSVILLTGATWPDFDKASARVDQLQQWSRGQFKREAGDYQGWVYHPRFRWYRNALGTILDANTEDRDGI